MGLLGVGLLFSVGHLGRPRRGPLALLRVGRSPLSNEVVVVLVTVVAGLAALLFPTAQPLAEGAALAALLGSVLALLTLGIVYRLRSQLTWKGPPSAQPFLLGAAFGATLLLGVLPDGTRARGELLILLLLLADGLLVLERFRRTASALRQGTPAHPFIMRRRVEGFLLRILTGTLLPAGAILWRRPDVAGVLLFLNLFLDRFLFYGLGVRADTEAEVERVEGALRRRALEADRGGASDSTLSRAREG